MMSRIVEAFGGLAVALAAAVRRTDEKAVRLKPDATYYTPSASLRKTYNVDSMLTT